MADERNQGNQGQSPDQEQDQKRRAPGSEQEYQGGLSNQKRDNTDQEQERKRA